MAKDIDKFVVFTVLDTTEQQLFRRYQSPAYEASVVKWVPLDILPKMVAILRKLNPKQKVRIVYRGPRGPKRYCHNHQYTLKEDAVAASLYYRFSL